MRQSTGTAAPARVRVVERYKGCRLIVALPLPPSMGIPRYSSPSLSASVTTLPMYDRAFWRRHSYNTAYLRMSTIICGLGLKQVNTGPGKATFTHGIVTQLAAAVTEAAAKLPTTKEELLEAASDYDYTPLKEDVAHLLYRFGDEIWGAERERTWLLQASESKVGYHKDLVFEDVADQVV